MTKRTVLILALAAILPAVLFAALSFAFIGWSEEGSDDFAAGVILRDSAGEVMRVSLGEGDVDCRPYYVADENDWIVKALIAAEDGEFWSHYGIRPLSVIRAAIQNVFYRRRISGASTITMQAVRLIKPHPKTMWWKWREAVMAVKMEMAKSKIWILSQYLNRAPYGSNFIGIEAAARGWFGKGAKDLGIGEAAMLAGMVQAPSRFRPDRGYEKAFRRRDYVLNRMETLNFITDFDSAYCGRVTLADSLVLSLNVPFVRLLRTIGVEGFGDKLHELGFRNQYHAESGAVELGLGMVIGNVEVSLVELTQAYATLARGGDGIFSRESAYLVSDILSGAERSGAALGHIADVVSSRFAWKTGTSSAYRVEGGSTKGPIMV